MRTEHYLFLVLESTPKSRAKVCAQLRMSFSPQELATDRSKAMIWCNSYFEFVGVMLLLCKL